MKKAITLINPKGERKDLTNVEFFDLQTQFAKSKAFARWSETRKIEGWVKHGKEYKLSVTAVNLFLKESGYQTINNLKDVSL